MSLPRFCAAAAVIVAVSPPAQALTQPGSTTPIPVISGSVAECSDNNVQACLNDEEGEETIDAQADGDVVPETFDPACNLTFHILNRGAGYNDVFGWYNVELDEDGNSVKPDVAELFTFILGSEDPPISRTLDLRNDANYAGGEIGFFIATGNPRAEIGGPPADYNDIFYSERQHNPDEPDTEEPSIHLVIWQSVTFQDSFYFGWEDLLTGNDNDFDDIFTRVAGIQCAGGGADCDTGEAGVCQAGTMQCQQGELACVPNTPATSEVCNALDDDCDGLIDQGEDICPDERICDRGKCVPPCGSGEFRCLDTQVCSDLGACVDKDCVDVECPDGQVCTGGECIDGCEGVTCPYAEVCRLGRCVDPCDNIVCDEGYSCERGVCLDCDCGGCSSGETCHENLCIADACAVVVCGPGTHCDAGDCLDDCEGVVCPGGAACVDGDCESPDGSGEGGSATSGGGIVVGTGGGATSPGAGPAATGGSGTTPEAAPRNLDDGNKCACRGSGSSAGAFGAALALALAAAFGRRRRSAR
jgi:hypothetical protein